MIIAVLKFILKNNKNKPQNKGKLLKKNVLFRNIIINIHSKPHKIIFE